jgi:hypothetical protein
MSVIKRVGCRYLPQEQRVPQLERSWSIPLRGVEIDRADQGEAVEDERKAPSGNSVRFVDKTEM